MDPSIRDGFPLESSASDREDAPPSTPPPAGDPGSAPDPGRARTAIPSDAGTNPNRVDAVARACDGSPSGWPISSATSNTRVRTGDCVSPGLDPAVSPANPRLLYTSPNIPPAREGRERTERPPRACGARVT